MNAEIIKIVKTSKINVGMFYLIPTICLYQAKVSSKERIVFLMIAFLFFEYHLAFLHLKNKNYGTED